MLFDESIPVNVNKYVPGVFISYSPLIIHLGLLS